MPFSRAAAIALITLPGFTRRRILTGHRLRLRLNVTRENIVIAKIITPDAGYSGSIRNRNCG